MLEPLGFVSIKKRLKYNINLKIYKALSEMMPREVIRRLELKDEQSGMRTRQVQNIKIEMRKASAKNICGYKDI